MNACVKLQLETYEEVANDGRDHRLIWEKTKWEQKVIIWNSTRY